MFLFRLFRIQLERGLRQSLHAEDIEKQLKAMLAVGLTFSNSVSLLPATMFLSILFKPPFISGVLTVGNLLKLLTIRIPNPF